ncbi:hypothetical protein EYC84_009330 [Monilinia fructicola]|uniref:Uncharacterized protein n=1 Tax=Monilinia fructicola TaxID=38448 RepID=A0A5M9J8G3_MONFR|nr:hypothetical protein EYC84_009330 [Monilinia fructicola]
MSRAQERTSYQPPPRRKQYRVLFLGNAATGKASMRNRIIYNEMQQPLTYDASLEDGHRKSMTIDSEECIVDIVETDSVQAALVWRAGVSVDDGETGEGQGEEEWGGEKNLEEMCGDNDRGNLSSEQYELSQ